MKVNPSTIIVPQYTFEIEELIAQMNDSDAMFVWIDLEAYVFHISAND